MAENFRSDHKISQAIIKFKYCFTSYLKDIKKSTILFLAIKYHENTTVLEIQKYCFEKYLPKPLYK